MKNARQDSPRPVRLIFDITPSWWRGRLLYGDASEITAKLKEIAADKDHCVRRFVGCAREIRFDVNRVEIECIDLRQFTSDEGPDFTAGGDRAILVHELEKLRPTPGDAIHRPTAVHADLLRGTEPLAAIGDAMADLMQTLGSFSRAVGGPRSVAEAEFLTAGYDAIDAIMTAKEKLGLANGTIAVPAFSPAEAGDGPTTAPEKPDDAGEPPRG